MKFMTFHILGIIIPTDELHHFSEGLVGIPPTRLYRLDPHPHIIPYLLPNKPSWAPPENPKSQVFHPPKIQFSLNIPQFANLKSNFGPPQFASSPKPFACDHAGSALFGGDNPGLGVSSGYFAVDGPENAFDGDSVTGWVANCDVSCNETRCAGADRGHRGGKYGRGIKCIKHQQNWGYPV